jgi:hypothetical protein
MKAGQLLPIALKELGLLPQSVKKLPKSVRYQAAPILDV